MFIKKIHRYHGFYVAALHIKAVNNPTVTYELLEN